VAAFIQQLVAAWEEFSGAERLIRSERAPIRASCPRRFNQKDSPMCARDLIRKRENGPGATSGVVGVAPQACTK